MDKIVNERYTEESFLADTAREIEAVGYKLIPDFFSTAVVERAVDSVNKEIAIHGTEYFSLRWQQYHEESILREIRTADDFKEFLRGILQRAGTNPTPEQEIHGVLRVSIGQRSKIGSNKFHFDAYNLTALMPIVYPADGFTDKGDLVVFPNIRPFSHNVISNFIWKGIFQNRFARMFFAGIGASWLQSKTVDMRPGDLLLFFGYRTYHGNKTIDPETTRATALFHFDDPHSGSRLVQMIEEGRKPPQKRG